MKLIKNLVAYVLLVSLVCTSLICVPASAASVRFDYTDIPLAPETDFTVSEYTADDQSGVLLLYYRGTASRVRVPDTIDGKPVLAICSSCFKSNDSITHIILPDTLKYAEEESFADCSKLEVLHLGSLQGALDYHGLSWLMKGCTNLHTLSMSDQADFPISYYFGAIESISGAIFYRETLDSIREIYIGKSMSKVCVQLFGGSSLEWVEIGSGNPNYSSHKGIVYSADGKRLIICGTSYKSADYIIPDGVTAIESSAFQDCKNIKRLTIPDSVTEIKAPFDGCDGLTIYGATGSAAYEYATKHDIPFIDKSYVEETGVTVSPSVLTINHGQSKQLTAAVAPSDATRKTVTWSSSNESIVTVDSSGVVKGKSVGTATVTAKTHNGKTAICNITVKPVLSTGISLNKTNISIPLGGIETLNATVSPSNATDKSIRWSSSNTDVATVTNGTVKAKAIGTATVTAETSNGKTATCRINVKKADSVSVNATKVTIYALEKWAKEYIEIPKSFDTSFQLSVTGVSDARYVCVEPFPIISVSEDGLITPVVNTYYWYGHIGTTVKDPDKAPDRITEDIDFGETTVKVYADDKVFDVVVDLVDYGRYYAENIMNNYVKDNIKSSMSTYEKADTIAKFVADRNYSSDFSSYTGLVLSGGGDCWASTSAIVYMAHKAGLKAWDRNGNKDPGAGSGHVNAIISDGTLYYEVEAGYVSLVPRYYYVKKRDCLYSYHVIDSNKAEIYQYDAWDFPAYFNIPSEVEGKKVVSIGDSFMPRRSSKTGEYTVKTVTIPDTVTKIGNDAFTSCYALEKLSLPDSLTEIGDRAFIHCYNLKSVYIPESVTEIGEKAFGYSMYEKISDFTIYGHKDSAAEKYAAQNGFTFIEKDYKGVTVSGKITSYLSDSQPVSISLIQDGKIMHNVLIQGNISEYSIPHVKAGKYTMRVSKTDHVSRDYTLTVKDSKVTKDAIICPIGDVTGDGKTNVQDCTAILRYVRKLDTLSDDQLKSADVTGDGKVNVQDVTRILRHVRKIETLY